VVGRFDLVIPAAGRIGRIGIDRVGDKAGVEVVLEEVEETFSISLLVATCQSNSSDPFSDPLVGVLVESG